MTCPRCHRTIDVIVTIGDVRVAQPCGHDLDDHGPDNVSPTVDTPSTRMEG